MSSVTLCRFLGRSLRVLSASSCHASANPSLRHASNVGGAEVVSLKGRDLLSMKHYQPEEIKQLLWTAADLKLRIKEQKEVMKPLAGKSVSMVFQKRSTRTRLSTESGMALLGGHAEFLGPDDVHIGVNESIKDTARVLSRMSDAILARVYSQRDLDVMADEATVPVISGLSDVYHPLQVLADFQTLQEHFGYLRGLKIAWVGDGNNILHSLMLGCSKLGIDLALATPKGYEPDPAIVRDAVKFAAASGSQLIVTYDPLEAVYRADAIITDTWVSMGQEDEKARRIAAFKGYQVNRKMLKDAGANWVFLHCLPRKQEEVTDDVFYDRDHSLVWDEAENRKWTVMSVLLHLMEDYKPRSPRPFFLRGEGIGQHRY
ncbi:hypothetical protein BaRGS_00025432 [Batillaria attramentaria]|uniref:ornithine carbamoyltransferase n=1 Tax=Batillaria attramentaria TaxID=370345 RepID=A0ABD0K865_9CAEN